MIRLTVGLQLKLSSGGPRELGPRRCEHYNVIFTTTKKPERGAAALRFYSPSTNNQPICYRFFEVIAIQVFDGEELASYHGT